MAIISIFRWETLEKMMRKLREHFGVAYFQTNPDLALLKLRSMYDGRIRATSLIQCLANQCNRAMFSNLRPDRIEHPL